MKPDLLEQSETPRTDELALPISSFAREQDVEVVPAAFARTLERELAALRDVADEMGRALRRGPFEADYTFGERRQMAYEKYAQLVKETLK